MSVDVLYTSRGIIEGTAIREGVVASIGSLMGSSIGIEVAASVGSLVVI